MNKNIRQLTFPFHKEETQVTDGKELNVGAGYVLMNISVTGNATGFNLVVEAKSNDTDDYTPVSVVNLETFAMSPNITANGKYSLPLEGYVRVRLRLSAIGAGAVTAKGTVTN
jgi:hypothetical protein